MSNPALGDFLHLDAIKASMPPRTTEGRFRKVRLCQFVGDDAENYLSKAAWDACRNVERLIQPHTRCVIGLDGSRVADHTAVVLVTVEETPRIKVLGHWVPPLHDAEYQIPIPDVMDVIRQACKRYDVLEVACDPYGFSYPIAVLRDEGLPMVDFPNNKERMAPPTSALRDAVHNKEIEHDGNPQLAQHVTNAVVSELPRGLRVTKPAPKSARKIDLLAATLAAYDRAVWNYVNKPAANDWYVF